MRSRKVISLKKWFQRKQLDIDVTGETNLSLLKYLQCIIDVQFPKQEDRLKIHVQY